MSRGDREITQGILKHSMRDNYSEHGVEEVRTYEQFRKTRILIVCSTTEKSVRRIETHTSRA